MDIEYKFWRIISDMVFNDYAVALTHGGYYVMERYLKELDLPITPEEPVSLNFWSDIKFICNEIGIFDNDADRYSPQSKTHIPVVLCLISAVVENEFLFRETFDFRLRGKFMSKKENKEQNDLSVVSVETVSEQEAFTVQVYLDDGRVFEYDVPSASKVREHAFAIISTGYRSCSKEGVFEHFPPHRISKVKSTGITTSYPDRERGT